MAKISYKIRWDKAVLAAKCASMIVAVVWVMSGESVKPALANLLPDDLRQLTVDILNDTLIGSKPVYGPPQPPSVEEVLLEACQARGYDQECAQVLLGMAWKESNFKSMAVGDRGRALGFFQIHYRLHNVEPVCARDLRCSADWTLDYLERNGYPHYRTHAVQCHNGCHAGNGYAASVWYHGRRLWNAFEQKRLALADGLPL